MKLVKLLVQHDTSWENTGSRLGKQRIKFHQYGKSSNIVKEENIQVLESAVTLPNTPLLLATKHNCTQVVEEILEQYPQAIEHIDQDGRNILHVANLHRNFDVFDLVVKTKYARERLRGKIDNEANTLMHMVGREVEDVDSELKGPALVLKDNLMFFKKVMRICPILDRYKLNSESKTAQEFFYEKNDKRRSEAKNWLVENSKNYSVVAVLIATVAFAAAYTVPGGTDKETGEPVLKGKLLFTIFTIADVISLSAALTSVILFLNVITSTYRFVDFEKYIVGKLNVGIWMLMLSVVMLMVAFAVTLILTISSGQKWADYTLYAVSFFPVSVFVTYFHVQYISLRSMVEKPRSMFKYMVSWFTNPKPKPVVSITRRQRPAHSTSLSI